MEQPVLPTCSMHACTQCMYTMQVHMYPCTHVPMYSTCTEKKFACRVLKAEQSLKAEQKSVARPL